MANTIDVQFAVCAKLFKMLLNFGKRYVNDSYSITLYLNMGRMIKAEEELNQLLMESRQLIKNMNFLRL